MFAALVLGVLMGTGCAILPRGPVVQRTLTETFTGRPDGLRKRVIILRDDSFTRGVYVFTDPAIQTVCAWHTNALELGGGSRFMAGNVSITVDSNLVPAIAAGGTAVGNIVGATVKTIAK
jgi:hypothetical protein